MQHDRRLWIVCAALCLAMSGDVLTTYYGIEHAGLSEANPAVKPWLDAYGYGVLFVGKAVTIGIAFAFVGLCKSVWDDETSWVVYSPAIAMIVFNAAVTAHNGLLILSA